MFSIGRSRCQSSSEVGGSRAKMATLSVGEPQEMEGERICLFLMIYFPRSIS